jgi:glutathione S-transferase
MKLYGFPGSPNTWKVRAVAAHLGIPLEFVFVDLTKGQSHTPEFLAINPTGRTPALVDGGFTLWESNAIMQYLASQSPTPLWPDDVRTRTDITRWMCWQLAHWSKEACEPLIFERLVKPILGIGTPDAARVEKGIECFDRDATVLDAHLSRQPYLTGTALTLADFSVAAPLLYSKEAGMPVAPYANLQTWFARVAGLPAWRDTAPQPPGQ